MQHVYASSNALLWRGICAQAAQRIKHRQLRVENCARSAPPADAAHTPSHAPRPRPQFLACKNKDEKPSACLAQGEAVHKCVYDLYQEIAKKAQKEFAAHAKCLDGSDLRTQECKKTQRAFETAYYSQS